MKSRKRLILPILMVMLLAVTGCTSNQEEKKNSNPKDRQETKSTDTIKYEVTEAKPVKISRIFGVGYPGNDQALYVASNAGLKMFIDGKWFETTTNNHKYMGFQAVESGFISSGHPQKGADLKDPLGLVRSTDKGETLEKLAFYGQANFVFMAAGYSNSNLYLISDQQKNGLSMGVNYSKDNGETWKKSELNGFKSDSLGMIAVHPAYGDTIAMATRSGIYYSNDNGNTMKLISDPVMITALAFAGDLIIFSSVENEQILLKTLNPSSGEQISLNIPFLDYDNPITYITVNPKNPMQIAFSTYKNDLYETVDVGKSWENLLKEGKKESE
ncbi:F510_1955 family glycosylhydrolase [Neobacillus niacini]|uniref:F510_1955 family glycosylhydrolase n=1 Tax=Neobacillus niacini TaxID=86668 RepID=UPI0021CB7AD2|nr:hypothetical protein [Neobacillus niacini]MCM3765367.1 hypothetical protein [Neobacillus niacini]